MMRRCDAVERGARCLRRAGHQSAHRLYDPEAEALWAACEALEGVLREVLPSAMGGYPDLFSPAGGWKAWEARARALLSRDGGDGAGGGGA